MKVLETKIEFKTNLRDLIEGFLFCTDNLDRRDNYYDTEKNEVAEKGIRLLYKNLIDNPNPHTQLFNQGQIRLQIFNISRACLQEVSRHRYGWEMTVKSTRYSLHRIANDKRIPSKKCSEHTAAKLCKDVISDYYYIPENDFIDNKERDEWLRCRLMDLVNIKKYKVNNNVTNDMLKKYVNDYMLCNINIVCSFQALRNFLTKRLSKQAFYQIRDLAQCIYNNIPDDYKFLFKVFEWKRFDKERLCLNIAVLKEVIEESPNVENGIYNNEIDLFGDLELISELDLFRKDYLN